MEGRPKRAAAHQTIVHVIRYSTRLKCIIAGTLILLILQFFGLKFWFEIKSTVKPHVESTKWEAVKLFVLNSDKVGLPIFVIETSLLQAVRDGNENRMDLWKRQLEASITFGVKEPDISLLHRVVQAMQSKGYTYWEKQNEDPRGVASATERSHKVITTHILLWKVLNESHTPMLIHLVVFFERQGFLWHAVAQDKLHVPPFDLSQSKFGRQEGAYSLFGLSTVYIEDVKVMFPENPSAFLKETLTSEFIECNHTQAHVYNTHYDISVKDVKLIKFQQKVRQLLSSARDALNSLNIPFWLSSGTCLGWFRQCGVIPYTTDVDIGIFSTDYREELLAALKTRGFKLIYRFGKVSDSFELSFMYGNLKMDIFFSYITDEYIWRSAIRASTGKKYKYIFPRFKMCWTEFLELWVRIPCPTLSYIEAFYGSKWMFPDEKWDWEKSPKNQVENGYWPKEEWHEVIQIFH